MLLYPRDATPHRGHIGLAEAGHGQCLRGRGQRIGRLTQLPVQRIEIALGKFEILTGSDLLSALAQTVHSGQAFGQLIRQGHRRLVKCRVINALEDLMETIQAATEPVVHAPPHALAELFFETPFSPEPGE